MERVPLPSFFARTIYYGPADWQNLNRVFPGSPDGTLSYRIAHRLIREVIGPADILVDVHRNRSTHDEPQPGRVRTPALPSR